MLVDSSIVEFVLLLAVLGLIVVTGELFLGLIVILLFRILGVLLDIERELGEDREPDPE